MEVILYTGPEGKRIGIPSEQALSQLTTFKPCYPPKQAEADIHRHVVFEKRMIEDIAPFYNGIVKGGLTREQALHAIARKDSLPGETWKIIDRSTLDGAAA